MNGTERTPLDPPWSLDLLADLHAGVLDPETEAQLRPRVMADPEAREVLAALDATVSDLQNLPPIPMPREVAERIDAALAREARPATPVVSLDEARKRRNRRLGLGGGVLAAAAAAIGVALVVVPGNQTSDDTGAQPQPTQSPTAPGSGAPDMFVDPDNLGSAVPEVLKAQNYGPLESQDRLAGCLQGGGITSTAKPLGISPVNLKGRNAVMAILPGGATPGQFRIVVLDPDTCGPDNPQGVIADTTIKPTR